jgi:hypothetical protein
VLAEEGVCKLDKPFSVSVFVDFVQSCRAGETERAQGVLRDPRSPLWALVVRLGYLVQSAHAAMTAQGSASRKREKQQLVVCCFVDLLLLRFVAQSANCRCCGGRICVLVDLGIWRLFVAVVVGLSLRQIGGAQAKERMKKFRLVIKECKCISFFLIPHGLRQFSTCAISESL